MTERRAKDRTRLNIIGVILIDEHSTVPCIVSDRSARGIRVTLPSAVDVPDVFILTMDEIREALVCRTAWRKPDQIGCMAEVLVTAWSAETTLSRRPAWV